MQIARDVLTRGIEQPERAPGIGVTLGVRPQAWHDVTGAAEKDYRVARDPMVDRAVEIRGGRPVQEPEEHQRRDTKQRQEQHRQAKAGGPG